MKCVAISDLHGYLEKPDKMPQGDVLCICGDIVPLEYQNDIAESIAWFCLEFVPWTDSLPYKKVIFVGGNHDFFLEKIHLKPFRDFNDATGVWETLYEFDTSASRVLKKLLPGENKSKHKLIYLCDNSVEIEGVTFYGTPWVKSLKNWAFYKEDRDLIEVYNKMPKKVDVVLSHMPSNIGDTGTVTQYGWNTDYSSWELGNAISNRNVKWALCGHVHSGRHVPFEFSGCKYVNVSIKDEGYEVNYAPFEFEV